MCLAAASWRELAIHGLAWRAARDAELLVAYSQAPDGSLKQLAVIEAAERWAHARETLLEAYLPRTIEPPP